MSAETVLMIRSNERFELGEGFGIRGGVEMVGAQALAIGLLLERLAENCDLRAEGVGDFDAHVAQTAEADDRDVFSGPACQCLSGE